MSKVVDGSPTILQTVRKGYVPMLESDAKECRYILGRSRRNKFISIASIGMIVGLVVTVAACYVLYSFVTVPCMLKTPSVKVMCKDNSFLTGLIKMGVPITAGILSLSPLLHAISLMRTSVEGVFYPQDVRFPRFKFFATFLFCIYVSMATLVALFFPLASLKYNRLSKVMDSVAGEVSSVTDDLPLNVGSQEKIENISKVTLRCAVGQVGLIVANMYLIIRLMLGLTLGLGILAPVIKFILVLTVPIMGQMAGLSLASQGMNIIRTKDPPTSDELSADMRELSSKLDEFSSSLQK